MRYARIVLGLLFLMNMLACGTSGSSEEAENMPEWAALVPEETELIHVIDWAQAREISGISPDSPEQMGPFSGLVGVLNLSALDAPLMHDRSLLGWDLSDVQHTIRLELPDRERAVLVELRDEVPFRELPGKLEALGYEPLQVEGGSTYRFEITRLRAQPWSRGNLLLSNLMLLDDPQLVVLAESPDTFDALLAARRDGTSPLSPQSAALEMYTSLEEGMNVLVVPDACSSAALNGETLNFVLPQEVPKIAAQVASLQPYESLGISARYVEGQPVAAAILRYADAASAEADLEERRRVAEEYFAQFAGWPSAHTLEAVRRDGAAIIVEIRPDHPGELVESAYPGLMTFVACP